MSNSRRRALRAQFKTLGLPYWRWRAFKRAYVRNRRGFDPVKFE